MFCADFVAARTRSVAVEFAPVAPVFFAPLFAIVETAIMFFADQVLETVITINSQIDSCNNFIPSEQVTQSKRPRSERGLS